jgi:hypothetical protein
MPKAALRNAISPTGAQSSDTAILHGCAAIMNAYDNAHDKSSDMKPGAYESLCLFIEEQAEVIAPIAANSKAGMKAKAKVVQALARHGMACYAERILAGSLAADVLAGGAI